MTNFEYLRQMYEMNRLVKQTNDMLIQEYMEKYECSKEEANLLLAIIEHTPIHGVDKTLEEIRKVKKGMNND